MGIPVGTAKSRLHRATQALRAALDSDARDSHRADGGSFLMKQRRRRRPAALDVVRGRRTRHPPRAYLVQGARADPERTRQRHAWASLERWLPMAVTTDRPRRAAGAAARLDPAHRRRSCRRRGGDRHRRLATPGADPGAPSRRGGRDRVRVPGRWRDRKSDGRHLHRQGRWHGPAPADGDASSASGMDEAPRVVARWHAHRLPRLPRVDKTRSR